MVAPTPKMPLAARRVKRYNLFVTIVYSHHGAGTTMVSHIFGEYLSLEECNEAGNEAKTNHNGFGSSLGFTCIPVYKYI